MSEQHSSNKHEHPVIRPDLDDAGNPTPETEPNDDSAAQPAGHHFGHVIGAVPETPNLSPGGSVTIKR